MIYSEFQNNPERLNQWVKECPSRVVGNRRNIQVIDRMYYEENGGNVTCEILQYDRLIGHTNMSSATSDWYMRQMGMKCRQINFIINNAGVKIEQGAMSYFQGPLEMTAGINFGNALGRMFRGKLTGEKISFPEYKGSGLLTLEPSFKFFILAQLAPGETIVCDKGMFYCATMGVKIEPYLINNLSGAMLGGEGLFQTALTGPGMVVLESPVPMPEINILHLENDILRVDGNFALLRTGNIQMTVERSAKTLMGSAVSGEGLINVFRGTGDVWLAPSIKIYDALALARSRGGQVTAVDMNTSTGNAR